MKDNKCILCGGETSNVSSDPYKLPHLLLSREEPGVMKVHCAGCLYAVLGFFALVKGGIGAVEEKIGDITYARN